MARCWCLRATVATDPYCSERSRAQPVSRCHATPALADLDGDGDLDLLAGESSGSVNYWRNDGTAAAASYTLVSDEWEGLHVGRRSALRAADLDRDGDLDLVVGNEAGRLLLLRNTETRQAPSFQTEAADRDWPPRAVPAIGDLDGDGDSDLLLGNGAGGLVYMQNGSAASH